MIEVIHFSCCNSRSICFDIRRFHISDVIPDIGDFTVCHFGNQCVICDFLEWSCLCGFFPDGIIIQIQSCTIAKLTVQKIGSDIGRVQQTRCGCTASIIHCESNPFFMFDYIAWSHRPSIRNIKESILRSMTSQFDILPKDVWQGRCRFHSYASRYG